MKIKTLIIDDMALARKRVRRYLNPDADIEIVGECADGQEAVQTIRQIKPDLIFLDVQMPGMSGFEVLRELSVDENFPAVIFVTAYDEFALQAFEVNALDYLLKPFNSDRFYKALNRAKEQINKQKSGTADEQNLQNFIRRIKGEPHYLKRLVVKSNGRVIFLLTDEIDWVEAAGNYLSVQVGKESHLIRETLGQLEQKLDSDKFVRVNRSVIINLDRIKEMHPLFSGDQEIILRSGKRFTMSRNYREKLMAILNM